MAHRGAKGTRVLVALFVAGALAVVPAAPSGADRNEATGAAVTPAGSITAGGAFTCITHTAGTVRCWGNGPDGALGLGDQLDKLSRAVPGPDVGTGRTVSTLSGGGDHVCALLDDATVKCWGSNDEGQLGLGNVAARGDGPNEMGDNLPTVPLGTGRTAVAISAGGSHSCALLDDASVKCWGGGSSGRLGQGNTTIRGDGPNEMGDNLPAISLGTGRTAVAISAGNLHNCAILDNGTVKCWGENSHGQLGLGDTADRGDGANEMGDNLPAVNLGTGRTAVAISASSSNHTCALLDDGSVKCWGENLFGELGQGHANDTGNQANEMGDNLPAINLGVGRTALAVSAGDQHSCALLDTHEVKCWGNNFEGQLGQQGNQPRGQNPGEMAALPVINLGTGRTATAVVAGGLHTCARLDDGTVKCWGENADGQLGLGDRTRRGLTTASMGDNLLRSGAAANNAFANATSVPGAGSSSRTSNTEFADTEVGEPDHAGEPGGASVWFRFTTTSTGTATIDTFGSAVDTVLAVYKGSAVNALTPVAANDDSGGDQSEVTFAVEDDTTYRIAVDTVGAVAGDVQANFDIDLLPDVSLVTPADGASYDQHDVIAADYSCAPLAEGPAVATCVGTVADGAPFDTSTPGEHEFSATVTDVDGNTRTQTNTYEVIAQPSLTAAVAADQSRVIAGEDIDYHITITNTGPHRLTSVIVDAPDVPDCAGQAADLDPAESTVVDCTYTTGDDDVPLMTNQVLVTTAQGAFGLSGTRRTRVDEQRFRPDAQIAVGAGAAVGNGVYNTTGTQQSRSAQVPNHGTATFRIPVQNDGNVTDSYTVTGLGTTARYTVTYKDGPTNITAAVIGAGYTVADLDPGEVHELTLVVRAKVGTPVGARVTRNVQVTSDTDDTADVVKAIVTRR